MKFQTHTSPNPTKIETFLDAPFLRSLDTYSRKFYPSLSRNNPEMIYSAPSRPAINASANDPDHFSTDGVDRGRPERRLPFAQGLRFMIDDWTEYLKCCSGLDGRGDEFLISGFLGRFLKVFF